VFQALCLAWKHTYINEFEITNRPSRQGAAEWRLSFV